MFKKNSRRKGKLQIITIMIGQGKNMTDLKRRKYEIITNIFANKLDNQVELGKILKNNAKSDQKKNNIKSQYPYNSKLYAQGILR